MRNLEDIAALIAAARDEASQMTAVEAVRLEPYEDCLVASFNRAGLLELARICVDLAQTGKTFALVDEGSFSLSEGYQLRITYDPKIAEN